MKDFKLIDFQNCIKLIKKYRKNKKLQKDFPVIPGTFLFVSFNGRKCDCNPLAIYDYLIKNKITTPDKCTWVIYGLYTEEGMKRYKEGKLTGEDWDYFHKNGVFYPGAKPEDFPEGVNLVIHHTEDYIHAVMQSQVIITNNAIEPSIPVRLKGQLVIGTWHAGGCYKTFGIDNLEEKRIDNWFQLWMKRKQYSRFLCDNNYIAKVTPHALFIPKKKILKIGQPRMQYWWDNYDDEELKMKIRDKLGIAHDAIVVLYAPTFRSSRRFNVKSVPEIINFYNVDKAIKSRFGEGKGSTCFLFRTHYFDNMTKSNLPASVIDVSKYPRVMELILISDILITDYSSIQWDFLIAGKPAFLFTPDLDEYSKHRDFYTDINDWAYKYYKNQEVLIQGIKDYDYKESHQKMLNHLSKLGNHNSVQEMDDLINIIQDDISKLKVK